VGWHKVSLEGSQIKLGTGQSLTLNGIAQGYATDVVSQELITRGFGEILVNVGEFAGYGKPWRLGLSDPTFGHLGTRHIEDRAIATSSPGAMQISGQAHILHPLGQTPIWSTVSVEAVSAALADGLSTALCLAETNLISRCCERLDAVHRVTTVDMSGNLKTFS